MLYNSFYNSYDNGKTVNDYEPLSKEYLLKQRYCCNNGCINCPYKENLTKKDKNNE